MKREFKQERTPGFNLLKKHVLKQLKRLPERQVKVHRNILTASTIRLFVLINNLLYPIWRNASVHFFAHQHHGG